MLTYYFYNFDRFFTVHFFFTYSLSFSPFVEMNPRLFYAKKSNVPAVEGRL
jgi:hypothetical protein